MDIDIRSRRIGARPTLQPGTRRAAAWIAEHELWWLAVPGGLLLLLGRIPLWIHWASLLVVPIPWICRRVTYGYSLTRTPLDFPILGVLLMSLIALYPSVDLQASLSALVQRLIQFAVFFGIVNRIRSKSEIRIATYLFVTFGVIIALISLGNTRVPSQKFLAAPHLYSALERLRLPYLDVGFHPNFVGGFLAILFPVHLVLTLFWARSWQRGVCALGLAVVGFGLLLTQSRGAAVGVIISMFVISMWRSRWFGLGVLLALVGLIVFVRSRGLEPLGDLILVTEGVSTVAGRLELWQRAIYMLQDFPYTGIGLNTFGIVAPVLYPFFLIGPDTRAIVHAHNLLLQVGVDTGIPGLVAFCGLLVSFAMISLDTIRRTRHTDFRALAIGLAGSFIAYFVHGLVEYVDYSSKPALAIWVVMGLTVALWFWSRENASL